MQLVMLAGELGERYGTQHEYYNLQTPADAIRLLCINHPSLREDLVQAHNNGIGYKVIQGGAAMGYDELHLPFGSKPLLVVPVITGSGSSTGQILLGVALVAAAIVFAPLGSGFLGLGAELTAGTFTLGAGASVAIGSIGTSLILGGTAQLLSPQPQLANLGANRIRGEGTNVRGQGPDGVTRGASGQQSYAFSGPANTVGTGATLPVVYGQVITGSHLVAVNLDISDDSDPLQSATQTPSIRTLKINSGRLKRKLESLGGLDSARGNFTIKSSSLPNKRQLIQKSFGPNQEQKLEVGAEYTTDVGGSGRPQLDYKKDKRKELDVIFKFKKGLFDYVGEEGTTKIDGFVTYEITVTISRGGPDIVVSRARVTLQGLVTDQKAFTYAHRLEMPNVSNRNGEGMDIDVKIVDVSVHDNAVFVLHGYGYRLLPDGVSSS